MRFVLALDQGTTSSRAIVFDEAGDARAMAQQEFAQHYPKPGWVEHDPMDLWRTQQATAIEAMEKAGIGAGELSAIGITNQRETTLLWDRKTGEPVAPAIVWQDRRTAAFCGKLTGAGHGELIQRKTGLVVDAYFSASKLRWLLDHVDSARARAEAGELAFGTVDSWLLWHLTGGRVHATDVTNASRTMLMNLETGAWDEELLALLEIPRGVLPGIMPSSGVLGETDAGVFGKSVPIAGVAGDQQAALFGQCCFEPGLVKNTYGTGCFMLMNVGGAPAASGHKLLSTAAWTIEGRRDFALEGSVFIGGAVVQWLRDGLKLIDKAGDVEALAGSVSDTGGVYLVPAFAGLGAPHWDPYARGTIVGLTRGTTDAHIARAALEAIALQVADVIDVMREDSGRPISELRVDGGAAANDLLLQIQADLLQTPVVRPKVTETTALGAAYLAGLATGVWRSLEEVQERWKVDRVFEPRMSPEAAQQCRRQWRRALDRAREWEQV